MASPAKLKLVKQDIFQKTEQLLWDSSSKTQPHSLFSLIDFPNATNPEFASYFIDKYSAEGEIVFDPFCGAGNIPLSAALKGRVPYCSDIDPFALCLTAAKLQPVDITEVTLFMQSLNLKKPVSIDNSSKHFLEFYDIETFREILNLRKSLLDSYEQVARFVEVIALSILHGNNAGYLSVYTNPQISLTPEEQLKMNMQRGQKPEYRSLLPRILKRTAQVTADGLPSVLGKSTELAVLKIQDARNLSFISGAQIDCLITSLPLPGAPIDSRHFWLKHWFSDIDCSSFYSNIFQTSSVDSWLEFMNESLTEFARIIPSGRYAIFHLKDVNINSSLVDLSDSLLKLVEQDLPTYWEPVELITNQVNSLQLQNALKPRANSNRSLSDRFLVLKRC